MQRSIARQILATAVLVTLGLAGCGGGGGDDGETGPGPDNSTDSGMSAKVDGANWTAGELTAYATAVPGVPGGIGIGGTQNVSSLDSRSITLSLYNVSGPGTYPLGVLPPVRGGSGQYTTSSTGWITAGSGTAGSVTFTTLSATRVVGTFRFNAGAVPGGGAAGTKVVTDGSFDLPLIGTMTPVTEKDGASVTATLNGSPYIASTVAVIAKGAQGFAVSTIDGSSALTIWLNEVTAPGAYAPSVTPLHAILVSDLSVGSGGSHPNWGVTEDDAGTITVTSLTTDRVRGTFEVTLKPQPNGGASGEMVVAGSFDVGTP